MQNNKMSKNTEVSFFRHFAAFVIVL